MLLDNAQDIVSKSYYKLGDLTLLRMRNHANGYTQSQKQKRLYIQSKLIRLNLGSVLDHLSYDDNANIQSVLRSTDEQINRFLKVLESVAEIDQYATAPTLFHKIKPKIINNGKDGNNAPNVQFQYSINNISWHFPFVNGDVYLRTSVDGGLTWGLGILFIDTNTFVKKIGDTMSGNLVVPNGTIASHAINKGQLDTASTAANAYSDSVGVSAKTYADNLVIGLWDDRGSFNASGGAYPSSGGSGTAGAIMKGDIWTISVAGTLPTGQIVEPGDTVRALIDTPGNTQANWAILQNNIGYVPVNKAGDTMIGILNMGGNNVTGLPAATTNGDAVRYEQVINQYLLLTGGTMSGNLAMGDSKVTGLAAATGPGEAVRYEQLVGRLVTNGVVRFFNSPFQPGISNDCLVIYSVKVSSSGGTTGAISLQLSPDNVAYTEVGRFGNFNGTGLGTFVDTAGQLIAYVPAGYYVIIQPSGGAPTYITGQEMTFG